MQAYYEIDKRQNKQQEMKMGVGEEAASAFYCWIL